MKLKPDLFASLPVPFALDFGEIGMIRLKIPVWNLFNAPLVIEISDILAVVRPKHVKEWSEEVEVKAYTERNMRRLEQQELLEEQEVKTLIKVEGEDTHSPGGNAPSSKLDQLVDRIVDNIEISLSNIYLRYEDRYSSPHSGKFVIGILLKDLVTFTTGPDWKDKRMVKGEEVTHKLLKLTNLSVFLDYLDTSRQQRESSSIRYFNAPPKPKQNLDLQMIGGTERAFIKVIQDEFKNRNHRFILDSFSMEARLRLNKHPERNGETKLDFDILLGGQYLDPKANKGITLNVFQPQLVRIVKLIEYIGFFSDFQSGAIRNYERRYLDQELARTYIKLYCQYRDLVDQKPDISFRFSFGASSNEINKAVGQKLHANLVKGQLQDIETQYPSEKIIKLRVFADQILDLEDTYRRQLKEIETHLQQKRSQQTKWGGLFSTRQEELQIERDLNQEREKLSGEAKAEFRKSSLLLEKDLHKLLGRIELNRQDPERYPLSQEEGDEKKDETVAQQQDYLTMKISVAMPTFILGLVNEYDHRILEIQILNQQALIEIGPLFMKLTFSMGTFLCKDLWTGAEHFQKMIETRDIENEGEVTPDDDEEIDSGCDKEKLSSRKALIVNLFFSSGPNSEDIPMKINVRSERTLFIICSFTFINEIIRTLSNAFKGEQIDMNYYHEAATEKALEFMNTGKKMLDNIRKGQYKHTALDLTVHLVAPMILVPENLFDLTKPCLLIDSGTISLQNSLIPKDQIKEKNLKRLTRVSELYDRYQASFQDFQINLLDKGLPNGLESIYRGCGTQIIRKLNIQLEFLNCIEPMHPLFPSLEMVFVVQNFDINASLKSFFTVMRIQESLVETIMSNQEIIFHKAKNSDSASKLKESIPSNAQQEISWERMRDENRKKSMRVEEVKGSAAKLQKRSSISYESCQVPSKANGPQQATIQQTTSFKMYFSVERLNIVIGQEVPSEMIKNQFCQESLINILMLHLGVEIDLDRIQNMYINVNVFKLLMEDIHKRSNIATPFRLILSSPISQEASFASSKSPITSRALKQCQNFRFFEIGVMQRCLINILHQQNTLQVESSFRPISTEQQQQQQLDHQIEVKIGMYSAKHEMTIKCLVSDLNLIFTLPTAQKVIFILKELGNTFADLEAERLRVRTAHLQMYDFIIQRLSRHNSSFNKEQDYFLRLFTNFALDNELDPIKHQPLMKEGLQRLKILWDMRRDNENKKKTTGTAPQSQNASISLQRNSSLIVEEVQERKEVIKRKMKIEATLKSLCLWVPLYAEIETSQVMQLSLMTEFSMDKHDVQENTTDLSIDEITKEDVLESNNQIGFSVNQLQIQMIQQKGHLSNNIRQFHQPRKNSKSIGSDDDSSLGSEFLEQPQGGGSFLGPQSYPQIKRSVIIPPCRLNFSMTSHVLNHPQRSKQAMNLNLEPLSVQIGFKHIDFFNIVMSQIQNTLSFMSDASQTGQTVVPKEESKSTSKLTTQATQQIRSFDAYRRKSTSPRKPVVVQNHLRNKEEVKHKERIEPRQDQHQASEVPPIKKLKSYDPTRSDIAKSQLEVKIQIDAIRLSLNDDSKEQDLPLIQGEITSIQGLIKMYEADDDAGTLILKKMGVWKINNPELALSQASMDIKSTLHLSMNYYNPRSLAREPLIENWDFKFFLYQLSPATQQMIGISSEKPLNINLTFGMALTLRKIQDRIEISGKQAEVMKKVDEGLEVSIDELEQSIDWRQKLIEDKEVPSRTSVPLVNAVNHVTESYEPGFLFQNHLGLDMKIALHDEFSDDNLESSIFNVDYDFKRKSLRSGSMHMAERREMKFFTLEADPAHLLHKSLVELQNLLKETQTFRSGGLKVKQLEEDPVRLDFKFHGLTKVQAVPIESLGVFSYRAKVAGPNGVESKRSIFASTQKEEDKRTFGVIFNIKMEGTQKKVSIESQLVIANNTRVPLTIFIKTPLQLDQDVRPDQLAQIEANSVFRVPLTWLIYETKVSMYVKAFQGTLLLFKNLAKRFSAKHGALNLKQADSRIIRLDYDLYASLDLQAYSCYPKLLKTNPPQFLVAFNIPLVVSNYLFQPLQLNLLSQLDEKPLAKMAPKETASIDTLKVDSSNLNLEWIMFEGSSSSEEHKRYRLYTHQFAFQDRASIEYSQEKFKSVEGRGPRVKREGENGGGKIRLNMEVRKIYHLNNESYQENFELRERLYEYTTSYQVMLYPKYMLVNKTSLNLISHRQTFPSYSNSFFNIKGDKASFSCPNFKHSEAFQINTVGLSGILALDLEQRSDHRASSFGFLPNGEYVPQRLELGLSISTASAPFNKTLIVTILPRYLIVNKLGRPLVLKQRGQKSQIVIDNQTMSYAFEVRRDRQIMVREPTHDEIIGLSLGQVVYPDLANDEAKFWSSPFSIDDVEDFQVSYPKSENFINYFESHIDQKPWFEASPENDYQRFARIIVRTQNEATIQVIITNPAHPEFEIVNKTQRLLFFGQVEQETFISSLTKLNKQTNLEDLLVGGHFLQVGALSSAPFTWANRTLPKRLLGLRLGSSIQEIDMEKELDITEIKSNDELEESLLIEVRVSGSSKKLVVTEKTERVENTTNDLIALMKRRIGQKLAITLSLKGLGLSFIDETPQELLFFSLHEISLSLYQWLESKENDIGDLELNSRLRGSLRHLQLDNMINQTMPVILIPSKPMSSRDQLQGVGHECKISLDLNQEEIKEASQSSISPHHSSKSHCLPFMKSEQEPEDAEDDDDPFFQCLVSFAETLESEGIPKSFRLRTLQCSLQEFIFQLDTSIFNSNLKFVMELLETFSDHSTAQVIQANDETFERAKSQKRDLVCADLDASKGQAMLSEDIGDIQAQKMHIELIRLGAIRAIITFRLEKRAVELDVADPAKAFGFLNLLYTLFAAVASISQSPMTFKELVMINVFATQDTLLEQLIKNYVQQAIMQFYKLLGSADLIGNPVGLVNKLGTGVYELISEPSKGLLKGPDEFVGGVGKGVQSLVSNVISGSFQFMSNITGSLYSVVKNVSGEQNVQIRRSEHIGEGIYYGVKGGVKELVSGVTGIVTKPIQKTREEGAKGFFKGLGSGIVGAITAPVTATLRAGTSLTQGVAASATSFGKYGKKVVDTNSMYSRFRPPRYINARNVVSDYDENLACVRQILVSKYFGKYGEDSIKLFTYLPHTKKDGRVINHDQQSSILIITETMLLYFRLEAASKFMGRPHRIFKTRLRKIQGCELYKVHNLNANNGLARRKTESGTPLYHIVITCYSQVKGQKSFILVDNEYAKFERIYRLLSILPFCEAINRVKKQRNSTVTGKLEQSF